MNEITTMIFSIWVRLAVALVLSFTTAAAQEPPGSAKPNKADAISWSKYSTGQGPTPSKTADGWQITIPRKAAGNPISGGYATGCRFRGDFDIQVEFRLGKWPGENGVRVAMGTGAWSVMRISLGKDDFGSDKPRERYAMAFAGGGISFANASDAAGRLRITRVGSKVTGYYRLGGRWVLLRSGTASTDDTSIALGLNTTPDVFGKKTVSATFENFRINNGECVTAESRKPELAGVEIVDPDTLHPIKEVSIGQSFKVRLTYAKDPGTQVTETVTVRASNGAERKVRVTGNSRVIVSKPVLVVPAATAAGRVEP